MQAQQEAFHNRCHQRRTLNPPIPDALVEAARQQEPPSLRRAAPGATAAATRPWLHRTGPPGRPRGAALERAPPRERSMV